MNKLNTIIIFLLSFVLLSPVFTTTSYAVEIGSIPVTALSLTQWPSTYPEGTYGGYTFTQVKDIITSYYNNDENSEVLFNTMISSLHADSYDLVVLNSDSSSVPFFLTKHNYFDFGIAENTSDRYNSIVFSPIVDTFTKFDFIYCSGSYVYLLKTENNSSYVYKQTYRNSSSLEPVFYSNVSVKEFFLSGSQFFWDGTSYIYELSSEPDTPTFPTNAQIASAVQKFYNSDIYKNNTNFKDFIVVYSALKNTYAFIGTDNHMLQEIFYDGVQVPGVDFSSSDTWWRFNSKFGDVQSFLFGSKFYLYFIEGDSDVITNEGTGTLYDLFRSKYSMNMTIVYSTYDYDVIEYRPPLEGETDNQVTSGTIQGDSYTYDENLDPTDNEYSPLQNYVPSDPTQSILNDVDFDSINQAFEDGKVILNIENASWIFTANNQLVEYFLGFISFLIVLIVISRVLGG